MCKKLLLALLLIVLQIASSFTSTASPICTIHGTLYEWSTFEPLRNVIITINTTPPQVFIARNGTYSFNLSPGAYLIEAKYYVNNSLVYHEEENITIVGEGDYTLDLLLFPAIGEDEKLFEAPNLTMSEELTDELPLLEYATISLTATIAIAAILIWHFKFRKKALEVPVISDIPQDMPEDLKQVLEIIAKAGGRMTQKDLRKQLSVSEAKVSLLLADLEDRGHIKKIKKGRGNIVILIGRKEKDENIPKNQ